MAFNAQIVYKMLRTNNVLATKLIISVADFGLMSVAQRLNNAGTGGVWNTECCGSYLCSGFDETSFNCYCNAKD
eukprot:4511050-Amphidinium_carterae.1